MTKRLLGMLVGALASATVGCTLHSTAFHWNDRTGANGQPVLLKSTTNVGMHLGILIPMAGRTRLDPAVADLTEDIAREGGDRVRIIEAVQSNYWWSLPPLSWFFSPVVTTVTAEYVPGPASPPR